MKNITDAVNTDIYRVSRESNRLKQQVSQCMPVELAQQILFVRVAEQKLRITVSNSAWAARLRFHSRDIIQSLSTAAQPIRAISVHVLPQQKKFEVGKRESNRKKPRASDRSVSTIRQVADSMGDEQDAQSLSRALGRLAKNLQRE